MKWGMEPFLVPNRTISSKSERKRPVLLYIHLFWIKNFWDLAESAVNPWFRE